MYVYGWGLALPGVDGRKVVLICAAATLAIGAITGCSSSKSSAAGDSVTTSAPGSRPSVSTTAAQRNPGTVSARGSTTCTGGADGKPVPCGAASVGIRPLGTAIESLPGSPASATYAVTLNGVRCQTTQIKAQYSTGYAPAKGNKLCVVRGVLKNTGTSPITVDLSSSAPQYGDLTTTTGSTYSPSENGIQAKWHLDESGNTFVGDLSASNNLNPGSTAPILNVYEVPINATPQSVEVLSDVNGQAGPVIGVGSLK